MGPQLMEMDLHQTTTSTPPVTAAWNWCKRCWFSDACCTDRKCWLEGWSTGGDLRTHETWTIAKTICVNVWRNRKQKNSNLVGNRLMTKNDWLKRLAFACLAFVWLLVHHTDEDISTKTTARRRPPSSRNDQQYRQLASETTNSILSSQQQSLLKQGTSCTNTITMAGSA